MYRSPSATSTKVAPSDCSLTKKVQLLKSPPQSPDYLTDTYVNDNLDKDKLYELPYFGEGVTTPDTFNAKFFLLCGNPNGNEDYNWWSSQFSTITITYEEEGGDTPDNPDDPKPSYDKVTLSTQSVDFNEAHSSASGISTSWNCPADDTLYLYSDVNGLTLTDDAGRPATNSVSPSLDGNILKFDFTPTVTIPGKYILKIPKGLLGNNADPQQALEFNDSKTVEFAVIEEKEFSYDKIVVSRSYWNNAVAATGTSEPSNLATAVSVVVTFQHKSYQNMYYYNAGSAIEILNEEEETVQEITPTWGSNALTFTFNPEIEEAGRYSFTIPANSIGDNINASEANQMNPEATFRFDLAGKQKHVAFPAAGFAEAFNGTPVLEDAKTPALGNGNYIFFQKPVGATSIIAGGSALGGSIGIGIASGYDVKNSRGEKIGIVCPKGTVVSSDTQVGIEIAFATLTDNPVTPREQAVLNTTGTYTISLPEGFFKAYINGFENPSDPAELTIEIKDGEINVPALPFPITHTFNNGYKDGLHEMTMYYLEHELIHPDMRMEVEFTVTPDFEAPEWDDDVHGATEESHQYWHFTNYLGKPSLKYNLLEKYAMFQANLAGVYNVKCQLNPYRNYTSPSAEFKIQLNPTFAELWMPCLVFQDDDNTQAKLAVEMPDMHRQPLVHKHPGKVWYKVTRSSSTPQAHSIMKFAPMAVADDDESTDKDWSTEGYSLLGGSGIDMRDARRLDLVMQANGLETQHTVHINGTVTGVEGIEAAPEEVRYFDLNGLEIANPVSGQLLIKLSGTQGTLIRF